MSEIAPIKLSDILVNELRKRNNLLMETGVDTTGGRGSGFSS